MGIHDRYGRMEGCYDAIYRVSCRYAGKGVAEPVSRGTTKCCRCWGAKYVEVEYARTFQRQPTGILVNIVKSTARRRTAHASGWSITRAKSQEK